jgi:oligopeptide/dipeptide ABC transporter ATP-binding protein
MSDATFDIQSVSKDFPVHTGSLHRVTGWLRALDAVSLRIPQNTILGLVGESGSGKTTLGRLLVKLLEPTSGSIFFQAKDITRLSRSELRWFRKNVQMLFQNAYLSLNPKKRVSEAIAYPLRLHGLASPANLRSKVADLIRQVGLDLSLADAYPHELSGGERQRVSLAAGLAVDPKFIFCDEPVSVLDSSARAQVLNLLREVQRERKLTMLLVSHDLSAVEYACDDVAVMYLGGVVERAEKDGLFADPAHPYTKALLSAIPHLDPDAAAAREEIVLEGEIPSPASPPSGCRFHTRCASRISGRCEVVVPALTRIGERREVACHLFS